MSELRSIIDLYRRNLKAQKMMALVTVLRVRGSSYRQPGSRMLITEEGEIVGSVSGGCLERDLIQKAMAAFNEPQKTISLLTYDTTDEGEEYENLKSISLGCQGVIDLSLEVLQPGVKNVAIEALIESREKEKSRYLYTFIEGAREFSFTPGECLEFLPFDFEPSQRTEVRELKGAQFLIERILPPTRWIIFGAGHDSAPLATLGKFLGWHVTIVDCHSSYRIPDRFFSHIDQLIKCNAKDISKNVALTQDSLCAVVTHNYGHDVEILRQLLAAKVSYIGLMGPKAKGISVLEDLKSDNVFGLYSPAGLDLGAEDPAGVAMSIVAEALTVLSGREGGFLRNREAPIHMGKSV